MSASTGNDTASAGSVVGLPCFLWSRTEWYRRRLRYGLAFQDRVAHIGTGRAFVPFFRKPGTGYGSMRLSGFERQRASVKLDDLLAYGQTQTRTGFPFRASVASFAEVLEEFFLFLRPDAHAGVLDGQLDSPNAFP